MKKVSFQYGAGPLWIGRRAGVFPKYQAFRDEGERRKYVEFWGPFPSVRKMKAELQKLRVRAGWGFFVNVLTGGNR
jgi:hypothetical protein